MPYGTVSGIRLMMLTQVDDKENNITKLIVDLLLALKPIVVNEERFRELLNPDNIIHCHHPNKESFNDRLAFVCPPIEYILEAYKDDTDNPEFNWDQLNSLYTIIKAKANEVFNLTSWART